MKSFLKMSVASILLVSQVVAAGEVSGSIDVSKETKAQIKDGGALFVFAKKPGSDKQAGVPPIAVLKIDHPQFPQKFTLTDKNVMMPGAEFKGPFVISARYSPSGDALDKSGPNGSSQKNIELGAKNVEIKLAK